MFGTAKVDLNYPVLDTGYVRLDDAMADDLSVVNSARVSFKQRVTDLDSKGEGLIKFLMRERHGTPFEHNAFRFEIKAPIFVAREHMRHRWGSFNEWSGRYSKLEPEFYIPEPQNVRTQVGKPGAYTFERVSDKAAEDFRQHLEYVYAEAWDSYEDLVNGIPADEFDERATPAYAKEIARLVLPVGIYTQYIWTVNARALMNFLSLRNSEQAMFEIREYAIAIERVFKFFMPVTHAAFVEHGRVAP